MTKVSDNNIELVKLDFNAKLATLLAKISERANNQFNYNLKENIPRNILKLDGCAEHGINQGVIGAVNEMFGWDTDKSVRFAYHIMEDANAYTECKALIPFIPEYQ